MMLKNLLNINLKHAKLLDVNLSAETCSLLLSDTDENPSAVRHDNVPIRMAMPYTDTPEDYFAVYDPDLGEYVNPRPSAALYLKDHTGADVAVLCIKDAPYAVVSAIYPKPFVTAGFVRTADTLRSGLAKVTELSPAPDIHEYYDPRDFFYENTQMSWENTYPIPADWGRITDATIENGMLKDKGLDYFTGLNVQWFGTYETDQGLKYGPLSGYYPYEQEPTPDVAITSAAWKNTITFLTMDAFTAEITPEDTLSESLTEYYSSLPADDKWRFVRLGRIFLDLAAHPFVMNSQWDSVRGYITDHLNYETMFVSYDPSPFFAELMNMLTPSFILSYAVSVKENPRNYEFMSSAMKYACGLHYNRLTSTAPDGSEAEKYNLTWQMPYFKYTLFQNAEGGWVYRLDRFFTAETAVLGEEHYTSRTISEFGSAIRFEMVEASSLYYGEFAPPYTQTEPVNVDSSVFVCNGEILHDTSTDTAGWYDFMPLNIGGEYRFWFVYHGDGETRFSEAKENEKPVTVTLDGNMEGPYLFFPVA